MSRPIDADILTKLESKQFRPFYLLHMDIDSVDYRYTDCDVPLYVPTGELIVNGNMEIDDNWATFYGTTVSNEQSSTQKHSGSYSRKFVSDGIDSAGIRSDDYATVTGKTYKVSLWVYPDDNTSVRVIARKGDNSDWIAMTTTRSGLVQDDWNLVTFEYQETAGGTHAFVMIYTHATDAVAGTWYIDEVSVQAFNVYTPHGFRFQSASYSAGRIVDQVQIEIDNLDSVMTSVFVDGTPQGEDVVLMMTVVDDDRTLVSSGADEIILFDGQIDSWVLDEEKLKVTVTSALSKWSQKTLSKHPKSCRWKVFKGTECQYAGGEAWCDRTYIRCAALSNTANYGGFRFLPSLVDKAIWWGRQPNI